MEIKPQDGLQEAVPEKEEALEETWVLTASEGDIGHFHYTFAPTIIEGCAVSDCYYWFPPKDEDGTDGAGCFLPAARYGKLITPGYNWNTGPDGCFIIDACKPDRSTVVLRLPVKRKKELIPFVEKWFNEGQKETTSTDHELEKGEGTLGNFLHETKLVSTVLGIKKEVIPPIEDPTQPALDPVAGDDNDPHIPEFVPAVPDQSVLDKSNAPDDSEPIQPDVKEKLNASDNSESVQPDVKEKVASENSESVQADDKEVIASDNSESVKDNDKEQVIASDISESVQPDVKAKVIASDNSELVQPDAKEMGITSVKDLDISKSSDISSKHAETPSNGEISRSVAWRIFPESNSDLYSQNQLYYPIRRKDYNLLSPEELEIKQAYLPERVYELLQKGAFPWPVTGDGSLKDFLVVRDENGHLRSVKFAINIANAQMWKRNFKHSKRPGAGFRLTRHIDPELKIWIVPNRSSKIISGDELKEVYNTVIADHASKKRKGETDIYHQEPCWALEHNSSWMVLNHSPFNCYTTWIEFKDWQDYNGRYPARTWPDEKRFDQLKWDINDTKNGAKARKQLDKPLVRGDAVSAEVTSKKILDAAGHWWQGDDQDKVMGKSAPDIARAFDWSDCDTKSGKNGRWPGNGCWPAEWLHRVAFSFGGLTHTRPKTFFTSQLCENLVFGTSESNAVMTRFEKAWQDLFLMEQQFLQKYTVQEKPGDAVPTFEGTITSRLMLMTPPQPTAFWHPMGLRTELQLNTQSKILGPLSPQKFDHICFTHQRWFFTRFESKLDSQLLKYLVDKRVTDATL